MTGIAARSDFLVLLAVSLLSESAWSLDRIQIVHSGISASQAVLFVTKEAGIFRTLEPW
jgi:hypothetical protein